MAHVSYEGMFIFLEGLRDEELDQAIKKLTDEITKLGGQIEDSTKLGKRSFPRPMQKKLGGHYVLLIFSLEGDQIEALHARLNFVDEVFRAQFIRVNEKAGSDQTQDKDIKEEVAHGVA